jgi:hypothetical protein
MLLEQLQQFGKSTWHLSSFGKTRKNSLQQFGKPTWQKYKLAKTHPPARIYARADRGCRRRSPVGGRVKKEIKNREVFLM